MSGAGQQKDCSGLPGGGQACRILEASHPTGLLLHTDHPHAQEALSLFLVLPKVVSCQVGPKAWL